MNRLPKLPIPKKKQQVPTKIRRHLELLMTRTQLMRPTVAMKPRRKAPEEIRDEPIFTQA
jgi:hypothetical protein